VVRVIRTRRYWYQDPQAISKSLFFYVICERKFVFLGFAELFLSPEALSDNRNLIIVESI